MNKAELSVSDLDDPPLWCDSYIEFCRVVMNAVGFHDKEVSIFFCHDEYIRSLNSTYRNIDAPTDVLSFEQSLPIELDTVSHSAGDIVISLDAVYRQAREYHESYEQELKRVTIHGMLHLFGYDHASNEISEPMLIRQEQILHNLTDKRII